MGGGGALNIYIHIQYTNLILFARRFHGERPTQVKAAWQICTDSMLPPILKIMKHRGKKLAKVYIFTKAYNKKLYSTKS